MKSFNRQHAFTLVELLVAISVVLIIGLLVSQMIKTTGDTTRLSNRSIDAAAQVRLAFDRLGLDLAAMLRRADVDFIATNQTSAANYALQFFAEVASPGIEPASNNRGISLVAYQVANHQDNRGVDGAARSCLQRSATPIPWQLPNEWGTAMFMGIKDNGSVVRINRADTTFPTVLLDELDGKFDILAPGIIRMIIGFQLYPDGQPVRLCGESSPVAEGAVGQTVYTAPARVTAIPDHASTEYLEAANLADYSRVSALIIGFVAVDDNSLKMLTGSQINSLSAAFVYPANGETPLKKWSPLADNPAALPNTVPLPARQALKVFQRAYPINPVGSR
jgi:prepilin-type N-terminal cleavage/methylation domain-containing protein